MKIGGAQYMFRNMNNGQFKNNFLRFITTAYCKHNRFLYSLVFLTMNNW